MEGQLQCLHLNYLHALQVTSSLLTILLMCEENPSHCTVHWIITAGKISSQTDTDTVGIFPFVSF